MTQDWTRLGTAVAAARAAKNWSQDQLATAAGTTRTTVQSIERGKRYTRITTTVRAVAHALGWADGSIGAVLAGGDPTPVTPPTEPAARPPAPLAEGMSLQVVHALAEGQVIGSEVIDLTEPGSDDHLIVVYKQGAAAPDDPEALRRKLKRWTDMQRALRGLSADPDDGDAEGA